jgi:hypothetical protein
VISIAFLADVPGAPRSPGGPAQQPVAEDEEGLAFLEHERTVRKALEPDRAKTCSRSRCSTSSIASALAPQIEVKRL